MAISLRTSERHGLSNNKSTSVMPKVFLSVILFLSWCRPPLVAAMPASSSIFTEYQPDGTPISLMLKGDERRNWMTDLQDFIVMKTQNGTFVYAEELDETEDIGASSTTSRLVPSIDRLVGKFHPSQLRNGRNPIKFSSETTPNKYGEDCLKRLCGGIPDPEHRTKRNLRGNGKRKRTKRHLLQTNPGPAVHRNLSELPTTGTIKNLVVLLQFGDHRRIRRELPSTADVEMYMESVKELFLENSSGRLTIESTVVPSWYTTRSSESWYADGQSGSTNLHEGIRDALDYLDDNSLVNFTDFDSNGDGYVDMLTVLHSGYGAEHGATDCKGADYTNRIWTHQWELFGDRNGINIGPFVSNDGIKVWKYQMAPVLWGRCGSSMAQVGAIAHEIGHSLGLPDLNDSDGSGNGLGAYDLMSDPWGFDQSQERPSQLSAWSKMKLGWLEPKNPVSGYNNIGYSRESSNEALLYKIGDGAFNFPPGEYLLIEYRVQTGMDSDLPGEGLLIYHIDEKVSDNDIEGHPWQVDGFPTNGKHYKVALLQADRLHSLERGINRGGGRDFFHAGYIDRLMPSTSPGEPSLGPFPNTDSYQSGIVFQTGVEIFDISSAGGATMSFYFQTSLDLSPTLPVFADDALNDLVWNNSSYYDPTSVDSSLTRTQSNFLP